MRYLAMTETEAEGPGPFKGRLWADPRRTRVCGHLCLIACPIFPGMPFPNRAAVCFGVAMAILALVTLLKPMAKPVVMPTNGLIVLVSSKSTQFWSIAVVVRTIAL